MRRSESTPPQVTSPKFLRLPCRVSADPDSFSFVAIFALDAVEWWNNDPDFTNVAGADRGHVMLGLRSGKKLYPACTWAQLIKTFEAYGLTIGSCAGGIA